MKVIRSMAMLAALALLCTLPAMAQEGGQSKPEGGNQAGGQRRMMMTPEERLKRMTDQLTLTQEQQDKIKPILEDNQKQMQALRDNGASMEDNREKMMKVRNESNEKIKAVLNDDQKKKFEEMNQRGPGGGARQGGDKPKDEGQKPPQ